jgi:hypothetical protein
VRSSSYRWRRRSRSMRTAPLGCLGVARLLPTASRMLAVPAGDILAFDQGQLGGHLAQLWASMRCRTIPRRWVDGVTRGPTPRPGCLAVSQSRMTRSSHRPCDGVTTVAPGVRLDRLDPLVGTFLGLIPLASGDDLAVSVREEEARSPYGESPAAAGVRSRSPRCRAWLGSL